MTGLKFTSPSGETTIKVQDTGRLGTIAPKTKLHIKMDEPVQYEIPMTERNFKKELSHSIYYDMENGNDSETIDYDCLIGVITELCGRIEALESEVKILNRKLTDDTFEVIKND